MSHSHIVLEIDNTHVTVAELSADGIRLLKQDPLPAAEPAIRETLAAFCSSLPQHADDYSCSWSTPRMTLVPAGLIGDPKPSELLQLALSDPPPASETDYNRLMSWNVAAVFHAPSWLKSVLIPKFPRIIVQHEVTHILNQLNTGSLIPCRIVAVIHPAFTAFVIRKDGKVAHCSYQQTQTAEDVLYHLLYCIKQHSIENGELFVDCTSDETYAEGKKIEEMSKRIAGLKGLKTTARKQEHLIYQRLCV